MKLREISVILHSVMCINKKTRLHLLHFHFNLTHFQTNVNQNFVNRNDRLNSYLLHQQYCKFRSQGIQKESFDAPLQFQFECLQGAIPGVITGELGKHFCYPEQLYHL